MKLRRALTLMAAALLFQSLTAGVVSAQTTEGEDTQETEPSGDENLSLIDEDVSALTGEQKLERAATRIDEMRDTLTSISGLLETVRDQERDILKVNCVNEKLAAIKGFVKVSEQSYVNLQAAVNQDDTEAAEHHYTLVAVAQQKVQALAEEARLCTGEEQRFAGTTDVEVTPPENGDEEVDGPEDDILVEDLPELSPYQ